MNLSKIFNVIRLYGSTKVYAWSFLATIALFFMYWGAKHPYNVADMTMTALSLAIVIVGAVLFVAFYTFGNRQLALAFADESFQSGDATFLDAIQQGKKYIPSIFGLLLCTLFLTVFAVPAIATLVGGFFQVSFFGHDFNILSLFLNFFIVYAWLFIGTAEIELTDMRLRDTLSETIGFIFDNFLKMFGYVAVLFITLTVFEFVVVTLYPLSRFIALPLLAALFAYVLAFINSLTICFVAGNLDTGEEDAAESEEAESAEDEKADN